MNLATITNKKKELRKSLANRRNTLVEAVFGGLAQGLSALELKRAIGRALPNTAENNALKKEALRLTTKTKKLVEEEGGGVLALALFGVAGLFKKGEATERSNVVFQAMEKVDFFTEIKKVEVKIANDYEAREKMSTMEKDVGDARKNGKIFYLVSSHEDCADDHEDWQGKLYYDTAWRNVVKDEATRKEVLGFIAQYKMKTFQWVTRKPVWLMTRPNCRHYYNTITTEEALARVSYQDLLDAKNMHHTEGQKKVQSIRHATNKGWYTRENIEQIIEQYEQRRGYHWAMRRSGVKSPLLDEAIRKDNYLIKKWKVLLAKTK